MNSNKNIPNRVIDYVGSDSTPEYLQVDIRSAGNYNNDPGSLFAGVLQVNCPAPDLDLTEFGISVQPP
jgi:hypothetical protein